MDRFESFVEEATNRINKVFVLDCGEGRETLFDGMDVEDLSGWLMDKAQADSIPHSTRAERDALFDRSDIPFVTAKWTIVDDTLQIDFEQ